ncbi:hypothetical protein JKP88DRAFT_289118 [Tribonema minus]|uniref:Ankyrin repeat protein n=1 Tax=Tribonema minus TaxID=303371 RepID=A0A835Z3R0_9STRA|nr:hypothetical protein JKP88DRAFT_289118 [Tribonema minus]
MSDAADKHLYEVLEKQLVRLSQLPWLTGTASSRGRADVKQEPALAELSLAEVELEGLSTAANAMPTTHPGVEALRCGVRMLEERLRAIQESCERHQQGSKRCAHPAPRTASARVFNDVHLRKEVLQSLGPCYWLYISGVSKALRSAYMTALAMRAGGRRYVCGTSGAAAAQSLSTFRMAQQCGITQRQLDSWHCCNAVGRSGSLELIRFAVQAGMPVNTDALLGAAEVGSVEAVNELYTHMCDNGGNAEHVYDDLLDARLDVGAEAVGSSADAARVRETLRWLMTSGAALFGPYQHDVTDVIERLDAYQHYAYETCFETRFDCVCSIMDAAIVSGRLEVVQWLRARSHAFTAQSANLAASAGHLPLLRWLHALGGSLAWLRQIGAMDWSTPAARATHLRCAYAVPYSTPVVRWLLAEGAAWPADIAQRVDSGEWRPKAAYHAVLAGCPFGHSWTSVTCDAVLRGDADDPYAAEGGHTDNYTGMLEKQLSGAAARLELINLAVQAGMPVDHFAFWGAAESASIEAIDELCSHLCDDHAVRMRRVREVLVWLSQQPRPRRDWPEYYTTALCCRAAFCGRFETLRWLMTTGGVLFGPHDKHDVTDACESSPAYERYVVFEMCFTTSCGFISTIMEAAIASGRLDVVQWLRAQSHAFTAESANLAAAAGHLPLLRWLHAHGAKLAWLRQIGALDWSTPAARATHLRHACEFADRAPIVRWLLAEGAAWPADLAELVETHAWSPETAQRAVMAGCPFGQSWTSITCDAILHSVAEDAYAAEDGHVLLQRLHSAGCPYTCPRPAQSASEGM